MNILLVGNYKDDKQQSMERFVELLMSQLVEAEHTVRLVRPKAVLARYLRPSILKK
jgi:hypothetical protein